MFDIVHFSNRLELLFEALCPYLFENREHPFGKILIIVPSLAMKHWVMQQAAFKQGIAFGFEIVQIHEAPRKIGLSAGKVVPGAVDLAIEIENQLKIMQNHPFTEIFQNPLPHTKKAQIALEVAELFLKYGEYAEEATRTWKGNWQAELWERLYFSAGNWTPLYDYLERLNISSVLPEQIHLFGLSYLSDVNQKFFERLNKKILVNYWILSPSRMLWIDQKSRKEQVFLTSCLERKGIKFSQIQELEGYLEETNPLIGNNGKLGRKWREKMEDIPTFSLDFFGISESLTSHPDYEPFMIDGVKGLPSNKITLLEAVQADLTLLCTRNEQVIIDEMDSSIEIHSAPSRLREVEVLYETLLRACAEHEIQPSEIIVMVPLIEKYAPHIQLVFSRNESLLPFEIHEQKSLLDSSYIRTFLSLLDFVKGEWDIHFLFEILTSSHFTYKNTLSSDDFKLMKTLFLKTGVRWGIDPLHRQDLCKKPLIETSNKGSWEGGLQDLLKSLIFHFSSKDIQDEITQVNLSLSGSEVLSRFIELLRQLNKDLRPFIESQERPLQEWRNLLLEIGETYFSAFHDEESREDLKRLVHRLVGNEKISSESLIFYFKTLAETTTIKHRSKNLQAVRFCPLLPMRAIPGEIIVILGMNSEVFPQIQRKSPLFIAETHAYIPTPSDYDRYLFLESLLSARKKWILSYVSGNESPSCLIQEVLHYLDTHYRFKNALPSEKIIHTHPDIPFDSCYFAKGKSLNSTSLRGYNSAIACRKSAPRLSLDILLPLNIDTLDLNLLPTHLTINQLKSLLFHPIKYHLNSAHGIYLQKQESEHPSMEEFSEERLWSAEWLKWALRYPIDQVINLAEAKGKLPLEPFKEASKERLKDQLQEWKTLLLERDIELDSIFEIEFSHDCKNLEQVTQHKWKAPPVKIDYRGKQIMITGLLPYLSKKGYLSLRELKTETLATLLPEILFLEEIPELVNQEILFIKKNKLVSPQKPSWNLLLDHYLRSLYQPMPHHPSWIAPILSGNLDALQKAIRLSQENPFSKNKDPYLKWVQVDKINCEKLIKDWKEETHLLFGPFFKGADEDI